MITPWPTLDRYAIDTSVDTWSTLNQHVSQQSWSVKSQLTDNAIKCQLSVDQDLDWLSTDCQPKYWSNVDGDVDQAYHSTLDRRYL